MALLVVRFYYVLTYDVFLDFVTIFDRRILRRFLNIPKENDFQAFLLKSNHIPVVACDSLLFAESFESSEHVRFGVAASGNSGQPLVLCGAFGKASDWSLVDKSAQPESLEIVIPLV